jgi:ribonuclease HI
MEGEIVAPPEEKPYILKVWTDGALREYEAPMVMGAGAVICHRGGGRREEPDLHSWKFYAWKADPLKAELLAIQRALESIPSDMKRTCHLIILSDSWQAVNALRHAQKGLRKPRSGANGRRDFNEYCTTMHHHRRIITHIRDLIALFPRSQVVWCRGHAGHKWNELANELAQKEAGTWRGCKANKGPARITKGLNHGLAKGHLGPHPVRTG